MEAKYFLTVDWCSKGRRGIFCDRGGNGFTKDEPHTEDEIWDILDAFRMVLDPKSVLISEEELKQYTRWYPLAEFSDVYGYCIKKEQEGENPETGKV